MADLGDGFTRIANELLEEVAKRKLNSTQSSIVSFICRYTYGFQRKSHEMSVGFIADGIGANSIQVKREMKKLIDWKVIRVFKEATFTKSREIGMNKKCEEWAAPMHRVSKSTEGTSQYPQDGIDTSEDTKQYPPPGNYSVPQERYSFKDNFKDIIYNLFDHWNTLKIVTHRKLTPFMESQLKWKMKDHSVDDLTSAMTEYASILFDEEYVLSTKWGLVDFLEKGHFEKFLPDRDARKYYPKAKGNPPPDKQQSEFKPNKQMTDEEAWAYAKENGML